MKLNHFCTAMALAALSANAVELQFNGQNFVNADDIAAVDWLMSQTEADANSESQATTNLAALAEAEAEYFDKVGKFANKAYEELKPTLEKVQKFAGPHAEQILGMTPMGQMLGLGPVGSIHALRQHANHPSNRHEYEAATHVPPRYGSHGHGHGGPGHRHTMMRNPYARGMGHHEAMMPRMLGGAPLGLYRRSCKDCQAKHQMRQAMEDWRSEDPMTRAKTSSRIVSGTVKGGPAGSQCCCGGEQLAGMYPQVCEDEPVPELAQVAEAVEEVGEEEAFGFEMTQVERGDGTMTTEYAPL